VVAECVGHSPTYFGRMVGQASCLSLFLVDF
jgi:hypothetical protein